MDRSVFSCLYLVFHTVKHIPCHAVRFPRPASNYPDNAVINIDKSVWLPLVIKFSYSPKDSWDLNKEITQTRKILNDYSPML